MQPEKLAEVRSWLKKAASDLTVLPGSFVTLERLRPLPWRRPGNSGPWLVRSTNPSWLVFPKKPIRNPFSRDISPDTPQPLAFRSILVDTSYQAIVLR